MMLLVTPKISDETRTFFLGLILVPAIWSCGAENKKKSASAPGPVPVETIPDADPDTVPVPTPDGSPTPVLAFLGGYTSCPTGGTAAGPAAMDLADIFLNVKEALKENGYKNEPAFILSCYSIDPAVVTYVISSTPDKTKNRAVDAMQRDFTSLLESVSNPQVFMVGHSYGAYTALEMMNGSEKPFNLRGLVTLDAISKVGCTPEGALPAVLGTGPAPKGCQEAPSDITTEQFATISNRTQTWLNFYQVDSIILHSGEIAVAKNSKLTYTSTGLNPHNDVIFDQTVKDAVVSLVVKDFFPDPP